MSGARQTKTFWATAVVTVFLFGYLGVMAWRSVLLLRNGGALAGLLAFGVLLLPLVGLWVIIATLREALTHQRLVSIMREAGQELDLGGLPRLPSGKLAAEAGEELVAQLQNGVDQRPGEWQAWYRLARGQDAAGNRSAARASMRRAVDLERAERARA
ncbi:hypothetical protein [Segniliparus rugosus]|uniref:Tetratricopeptide repeat protein n=1 Tax=Segniliparus rugosus (strain ATCC BAA-974 / DSM 45345 / CCUG 50838 / CIP 108380 / JCM 13579 / CDC 945) TaxID=679197 RepID=E5XSD6_SEGRC|nr:hypothetical protein [Segniliparus rugosus]EFV12717.1 hypothetical protein HMPREF9336_02408 [Segniliparus rugosus ATCC BAA-974]